MANQEKVLIVEDELHALVGLAELVSGWGYRTETARDGVEALEKTLSWSPGIVVTDLKMPRMDGLELLERLNELKQNQAVILLTAQGSIERAVEAMKMGAYDFMQKPVDATRLRTVSGKCQPPARNRARAGSDPPQAARHRHSRLDGGHLEEDASRPSP